VSIELFRIDDRLIHGQVVVGWGQTLGIEFLVLVDDEVRASDWEQELYRMGVPPAVSVTFASVEEAIAQLGAWQSDARRGIVLTGDVDSMARLTRGSAGTVR
jgi:mannose/fructose/N-acetylgalactosamine-specific phosphotransferase system component IIB